MTPAPLTNDQLLYFGALLVVCLNAINLVDEYAADEPRRRRVIGPGPKPR